MSLSAHLRTSLHGSDYTIDHLVGRRSPVNHFTGRSRYTIAAEKSESGSVFSYIYKKFTELSGFNVDHHLIHDRFELGI